MAIDQVHNETLKLIASWLNAASVAIVGGGTVLPIVAFLYGSDDAVWPNTSLLILCTCAGISLHFFGQSALGGLQSE